MIRAFYANADNLFNGRRSDVRFRTNIGKTHFEVNLGLVQNHFGIPQGGEDYAAWTQNFV